MKYKKDLIEAANERLKKFRKEACATKISTPIKKLSLASLEWLVNELETILCEVEHLSYYDWKNKKFLQVERFEIKVKERKIIAYWTVNKVPDVRIKFAPPQEFIDSIETIPVKHPLEKTLCED
jgi:hypothetical protein